jgi:hypothetical protein
MNGPAGGRFVRFPQVTGADDRPVQGRGRRFESVNAHSQFSIWLLQRLLRAHSAAALFKTQLGAQLRVVFEKASIDCLFPTFNG